MTALAEIQGQEFDVIVIGAGVAGGLAALLAAGSGLSTLLLERHPFPRFKVCGCCLNGRALQILRQHQLTPSFSRLPQTTTSSLAIHCAGRRLRLNTPSNTAVSRSHFDSWLVGEATSAGCRFIDGVTASVMPLQSIEDGHSPTPLTARCPNRRVLLQPARSDDTDGRTLDAPAAEQGWCEGKVVLVCDGLGHSSLRKLAGFDTQPQSSSRIGLGCMVPRSSHDQWLRSGEICMAVSPQGYVGMVDIDGQQLNIAAAVNPAALADAGSPLQLIQDILHSAGVPQPRELPHARFRGTPALTRRSPQVAGDRLFLIGDATGYIEPFTGEGMAWALSAASAVIPLVRDVVAQGWSPGFAVRWKSILHKTIGRKQVACRIMSAALKHRWLLLPMLIGCRQFPSIPQWLVRSINRVPRTLKAGS